MLRLVTAGSKNLEYVTAYNIESYVENLQQWTLQPLTNGEIDFHQLLINTILMTFTMLMKIGLFFKALPNRSLVMAKETCKGGKRSKERFTVLLCTNMTDTDKLQPLLVGKLSTLDSIKTNYSYLYFYSRQRS
jgi:hypothetical protein